MKNIFAISANDLRLFFGERGNLVGLIVVPVVMTFLVGTFAGMGDESVQVLVDVIDHDRSALSNQLIHTLGEVNDELLLCPMDDQAGEVCQVAGELDRTASIARVEDSTVQGLLEIPAGFGEQVGASEPVEVTLLTLDSFDALSLLQQSINAAIQQVNGAVIAAQVGSEALDPLGLVEGDARVDFEEGIRDKAADFWAENLVHVDYELSGGSEQEGGLASQEGLGQSVPGIGSMFVMFTVLGGMTTLVVERQQGTLQRVATMPVSRAQLLGGKILGRFVLGLIQYLVVFAIGVIAAIDFGDDPLAVVALMLTFTLATTALSFAIGGRIDNQFQANGLSLLLSMTLAPLGGAWWSLEIVPKVMQTIGHLSPVAWVMDGFHALIFEGARFGDVLVPIVVLLTFAAVCFWLSVRWFRVE